MGLAAAGDIRPGAAGARKTTGEALGGRAMEDTAPRRSGAGEPSLFSNGSK